MSTTVPRQELSPDRLAALEEERDFLLKSLADLDSELAAGDIDEADHRALTDDYTARAAEVLRAIDEHREAMSAVAAPRSRGRLLAIVGAVAVVAVVAGVLMAQASGRRVPGQTITGETPTATPTQQARACIQLLADQKPGQATNCFTAVLERDEDNATALTYLGWTLFLSSDGLDADLQERALAAAGGYLDRAISAAPDLADPHAFKAILAFRAGDVDGAAAELARFDQLDPPAGVRSIVDQFRGEIERAQRTTTTTTGTTTTTP